MPPTTAPPAPRSPAAGPRPAAPPQAGGLNVTIDPRKLLLQYWPWLLGSVFVGVALGVVTHFALLFTMPRYDGEVWFELLPPMTSADMTSGITVGEKFGEAEMERFIGTQIQVMLSENVIKQAVNTPIVRDQTTWANQFKRNGVINIPDAMKELDDISRAVPLPESNIVVLRVRTPLPKDSAQIANAIKDQYVNSVRVSTQATSTEMLESLNRRYNAVKEERRLLDEKKDRLFQGGGSTGLETVDERFNYYAQTIERLLPVLVGADYELNISKQRLDNFTAQKNAPSGPQIPEEIRASIEYDPIVQNFKQTIANLEASRLTAVSQYGPNHRAVKQLDKTIEGQKAQMDQEKNRLMQTMFDAQIELLAVQIASLENTKAETMADLQEARVALADVNRMKQNFETLELDSQRLADEELELQVRIAEANAINQRPSSNRVKVLASATIPEVPAFPNILIMVPVVTLLTIMLTGGGVVLREIMEQRVRGPADIGMVGRVKVLGLIPDLLEDPSRPPAIETAVRDRPTGVIAECIRQIRTEILKRLRGRDHTTLLVVSGMPQSGGTSTVINLAESLASSEHAVLVIDANLRRPRIHAPLGLHEAPGLSELLTGKRSIEEVVQKTSENRLHVISAGAADARSCEWLTTSAMERVLAEARERYEVVLIDAAPTIVSSDAFMLANLCDSVMLVVRAFNEKRGLVARIRNQLEETKADFLGVVINGVRASAGGYFRRNFRATHEYVNRGPDDDDLRAKRSRRGRKGKDGEEAVTTNGDITQYNNGIVDPEAAEKKARES